MKYLLYLSGLLLITLLAACTVPGDPGADPCNSNGLLILPTATRQIDPDLFSPPVPPDGGDGAAYCPTPAPAETPVADLLSQFTAGEVVNLSLDIEPQELAATAVGDDMLAVTWLSEGQIVLALARGGNHFQVRAIDSGSSVSLAFSRANRLHVAYEQAGQILYRAADQGIHPADVAPIFVADGRAPQVVVDELNWAHVLYEQGDSIFKAKHLSSEAWLAQYVTDGTILSVLPFYNEEQEDVFGAPAGSYWFGLYLAVGEGEQVRLLRYLSWFNLWQEMAAFTMPAGESRTGPVGLDYQAVSADEAWVYAAWVAERPDLAPPLPLYAQPTFDQANPLFPEAIANPDYLYQGLNAARWSTLEAPMDAGLVQTFAVPDPSSLITASAWGVVDSTNPLSLTLQLGLDPTGGNNPGSPTVVWSEPAAPATYSTFSVSAAAQGSSATLFLRGTLAAANMPGTAVWDAAQVQNGALVNGDFEDPFVTEGALTLPAGWSAWYEDAGNSPIAGRDVYTVYAAWSADGGASWSAPQVVVANQDGSGSTTGAIRPEVYPLLSLATEPPSATFLYHYESGDPPPGSELLRFGRPYQVLCVLGTTDCSPPPGLPLLPESVVRPSYHLQLARDPFDAGRAVLVWDALQMDLINKDAYITALVLR